MEENGLPLRKEATNLKISPTTTFHWRMKYQHALTKAIKQISVCGVIEIDAVYNEINLKGTRTENMPRYQNTEGQGAAIQGFLMKKYVLLESLMIKINFFSPLPD